MWNKVTILDGGMGTELERLGAEQVNSHRLWSAIVNVNQPEIVVQAHKNFIAAGARIIVANSYQANVPLFMDALSMTREEAEKATLDPILFARQAVVESGHEKSVLVAGSIGPVIDKPGCEYNPEYLKRMSLDEIVDWHHDRFRILVGSECDLLAMETIPGIKEIEALFVLLRRYPKDAYLSMVSGAHGAGKLNSGETWEEALEFIAKNKPASLKGVGINCTKPQYIAQFGRLARKYLPDLTLLTYPNSGEDWVTDSSDQWTGVDSQWGGQKQSIVDFIDTWREIGFKWVGGCCRVTPDEIKSIASKMNDKTHCADN